MGGMNDQFSCHPNCPLHNHQFRVGNGVVGPKPHRDKTLAHLEEVPGEAIRIGWQADEGIVDVRWTNGEVHCYFERHLDEGQLVSDEEVQAAITSIQASFEGEQSQRGARVSNEVRIRIKTPLPLNVTGALTQLIGAAWPNSTIDTTERDALVIVVDPSEIIPVSDERIAEIGREAANPSAGDFTGFSSKDGSAWIHLAPPEELMLQIGDMAHRIMEAAQPEAINYMSWEVHTQEGERYHLSVAKSKEQSPHELRMEAEARADLLHSTLVKYIAGIGEHEGIDFLNKIDESIFTDEEWQALTDAAKETS